jgi:hypothetical protein
MRRDDQHGEQNGNDQSHGASFRSDSAEFAAPELIKRHMTGEPQSMCNNAIQATLLLAHSALAPENFTTLAHFSVSSAMSFPN